MGKATDLLRKASQLVKRKKYADAVELYLQATETDPGDARAWFGLGVCLYKIGNLEVAAIALERADRMGYPRAGEALERVQAAQHRREEERVAKAVGGQPAAKPKKEAEKVQLGSFLRVMLVENIESDRETIVGAIEDAIDDVDITTVPYGASTSDTMSGTVHYDVSVLDWDTDPDAAAGLIQILKIKRPSLLVVCLTDEWDPELSKEVFEAGADYCLVKEKGYADVLPELIAQWVRRDRAVNLQMREKEGVEDAEKWPATMDALGKPLLMVGGDGKVLQANEAAMKVLRRGGDQLLQRAYAPALHGTEHAPESCPFQQAIQSGEPAEGEVRNDALKRTFHVEAWPVSSYAGKVTAAIGTIGKGAASPVGDDVRRREQLYRSLVERSNAGVVMVGPDGKVCYANQTCCGMLDQTLDELMGRPVEAVVTPEDQEALRECIEIAVDMGEAGGRLNLQQEQGGRIPTEARLGRLTSHGQNYLVLTFVEVKDLELAEQELWSEVKKLSGVLDHGMDALECGVAVLDAEGCITWLNASTAELLGGERDELTGKNYLGLLEKAVADAEPFLQTLGNAHGGGQAVEGELLRLAGREGGLTYWSTPVEEVSPSVSRVEHFYPAGAAAGITGEELPAGMADAIPDMLFNTDEQGRITWCNPAAPETIGYKPDRLEGMEVDDLADEQMQDDLRTLVEAVLAEGRQVLHQELMLKRANGKRFWGELTLLPVRNGSDSGVQGIQGVVRDITDRKVNAAIQSILEGSEPPA
ncbi:MAG: PAS domain S-box protein [Candidatus Brocadiia bacterium]